MPTKEEYIEEISGLWESRWLTNVGERHKELSARLKSYLEVGQFELFANGHMALELGLQALGLSGEVITTPFTFLSTTQAVVRSGLTPVFCDIDPVRWTLDPAKLEALITSRTSAILAVHVYGIPCDVEEIGRIAAKHGLKVIYDSAHAFGARYRGRSLGSFGDYSMFSFHATKVFHTVEGGGATFADATLGDRVRHLRDFGLCPGGEEADEIGSNGKLSEFHAAMGLCNLRHVDREIAKRKVCAEVYDRYLGGVEGLQRFPEIDGLERNYAYYPVVFHDSFGKTRDEMAATLSDHGIFARKYFYPLTSDFSCFGGRFPLQRTPQAKTVAERVLCLPMYADLAQEDIKQICDIILNNDGH
jgi:dTDP-4-amino-4,6-dideoxygalactose transaminase